MHCTGIKIKQETERFCYLPVRGKKHCYCVIRFGLNRRAQGGFKNRTSVDILFKSEDISTHFVPGGPTV